jgi:hypothetical protein
MAYSAESEFLDLKKVYQGLEYVSLVDGKVVRPE